MNAVDNAVAESRDLMETARENARRVWLAGLGAGVRINEESAALFQELVAEGEKFQTRQIERLEDAAADVRNNTFKNAEELRARVDELRRNAFRMANESMQWGLSQAERNPILRPGAQTLGQLLKTVAGRVTSEISVESAEIIETAQFGDARPLTDVHGISNSMRSKLEKEDITDTAQLLGACATAADRRALAKAFGVTEKTILKIANRADLARVEGIAGVYAELLERGGVDTVVELATRNAKNLRATLEEVNAELEITGRLPSVNALQGWIDQAVVLPRVLQY